ncbi:acetolactate decarboxylase [Dyadobacter sp. CY107]|uniref:acetolactate decarboxylase n=1 Tax=Dyadobacter fanqingshengii TaxID=2906443 RepID=UPI001F3F1713|nr:acetolactate decarboxylase [Dyadobacter fanqingshengii]MCF2505161.1 acetolactate decarboxylase [Dyadobacter fanqingshengii]
MKNNFIHDRVLSILSASIFSIFLISCHSARMPVSGPNSDKDFMYQYSIIDALMAGVFDGNLRVGDLKPRGDFGVGTFNKVDGELIMLKGKVYKMSADGSVKEVSDSDSTSAAFVKFFKADTTIYFNEPNLSYEKLQEYLVEKLNANTIYAIKITGSFSSMTTRAASPAKPPYTTLTAHLGEHQKLFNYNNTTGTCVGFLLPPYLARTNVPGFHLHYLADDLKAGGHIFKFNTNSVAVEIDFAKGFTIENNTNAEFLNVNLKPDRGAELKKIE